MWSFLYQGFSAGSCPIHHRIETRFCSVVSSARPGNPAPELFRQAKARFLAFLLHSWRIEKRMIAKSEHWNLSKVTKLVLCQLIAMGVCLVVTLHYSPASETLLQVNRERLLFYAATFGRLLFTGWRSQRSFRRSTTKRGMEKSLSYLGILRLGRLGSYHFGLDHRV